MKSFFKISITALFLLYLPVKSMAWGMLGHRIVGEIASSYLTPKAAKEVQKILGNETMAIASTWADFIRSDSSYKYLAEWHYADVEKGTTEDKVIAAMKADTGTSAFNRIEFLVVQLKNKSLEPNKKLLYLRMLIHIVGDVHQPFHVSEEGDKGGNDIKVMWFKESSNIHKVWDEHLIQYQELSYTEYTRSINFATTQQIGQWQKAPVAEWLRESYALNLKLHEELTQPNPKLGYVYNFEHIATVNERLLKAGIRLAGLLNEIFA